MSLLLTSFIDMLNQVQTDTYLLSFLAIAVGIVGFHIGSKNSTSAGLISGGLVTMITSILFFATDTVLFTAIGTMAAIIAALGVVSIYFLNVLRK